MMIRQLGVGLDSVARLSEELLELDQGVAVVMRFVVIVAVAVAAVLDQGVAVVEEILSELSDWAEGRQ